MSSSRDPIQIRVCAETDAPAFRELRLEALKSHPEAFSADYATNEQFPATFWAERLSQNTNSSEQAIFFAVVDGALIGMSGVRRGESPKTRHGALIWGVYVRPGWRGHRLSERLIAACVTWAREHEVRLVTLAVVTTNIAAIRSYARSGFTVYGVEPQAIALAHGCYDELLMVKYLDDCSQKDI